MPPIGVYNVNPTPTSGNGPYGQVPGPIGVPPSTFQQSVDSVPGLGGAAPGQLTSNILRELQGQLSPQALKNMQDQAARFGVSSGMPGSNAYLGSLANNKNLLGNILTTQDIQHQGQQDYLSALSGIGGQQNNPALLAEIAAHNSQLSAAPDPTQAAQQQLANYYGALSRSARGGPSGGTGIYNQGNQPPSSGSQALGFGFGTLGPTQGPQGPSGSWYAGNPATTNDLQYMGYSNDYGGNPATTDDLQYMGYGDNFGIPANTVDAGNTFNYDPLSQYGDFYSDYGG